MNKILWTAGLSAAIGFSACAEAPTADPLDLGYDGKTGLSVTIAPLDLASITDACYSFEITNQTGDRVVARGSQVDAQLPGQGSGVAGQSGDGGPELTGDALAAPLSNPLCADQFGNGEGAISYVAPCDASDGNQNHTITLWVNSVCAGGSGFGGSCTPLEGFVNPCGSAGCTVDAVCTENADTPVSFNFTVMASAQQGFFDIAVNFDNVFCSAKVDNCYEDGTPISLLHNGAAGRQQTTVAAIACTAGPGETTTLHYTDFVANCGGVNYTLDLSAVTQEGNLVSPNPTLASDGGATLPAAIYYGTEALPNAGGDAGSASKVYTNIAFLSPALTTCRLSWYVVPSSSTTAPQPADGSGGELTQVAGVQFSSVITNPTCTNDGLNDGGGVGTSYNEGSAAIPYSANLTLGSTDFGDVCANPCDDASLPQPFTPGENTAYCVARLSNDTAFCDLDTGCCVVP